MSDTTCNRRSRLAKDRRYQCNEETGQYDLINPLKCSKRSHYVNDERYYCNHATGFYKLRKEYQRVLVENAPKPPKTSYMLWVTTPGVRDQIKQLLQDEDQPITFQSVGRKFGEIWNQSQWPDGQTINKNRYQRIADKDKQRYQQQVADFRGDTPNRPFSIIQKRDKHTRGPTKYNQFYHEYRLKLIKQRPELRTKGHGRQLNELITTQWAEVKDNYTPKPRKQQTSIIQPIEVDQPQEEEFLATQRAKINIPKPRKPQTSIFQPMEVLQPQQEEELHHLKTR